MTTAGRSYTGWTRERFGPFLGLSAQQAGLLALLAAPLLITMARGRWLTLGELTGAVVPLAAVVVIGFRGRPLYRWLVDAAWFTVARAAGWSRWRSQAASGAATASQLAAPDLPGALAGLRFHEGPAFGPFQRPVCVIADPHRARWSAIARLCHPGLGTSGPAEHAAAADALGDLLARAALTEQIASVSLSVRTVPSDGAARAAWVADHRAPDVPDVVEQAGALLDAAMQSASVQHELFITVGVSDVVICKAAREVGRGVAGRARVLYRNLETIDAALRDIGVTDIEWLTTEQVAETIRTGYHPADAAVFEQARQRAVRGHYTAIGVPLGAAGPGSAPSPSPRRYCHDGYATVGYAVLLPDLPTRVGALSRLLAPAQSGERRCIALHYAPMPAARARRQVESGAWAMEIAEEAKRSKGFRVDRRHERRQRDTTEQEEELAAGHTLVRVAVAAALTVPADWPVDDHAARFEGDGRACAYVPLRADLAHDAAFVAACLPLGIGLPSRGER